MKFQEPLPFDNKEIKKICSVLEKENGGVKTTPDKLKLYVGMFWDVVMRKDEKKSYLMRVKE